MSRHWFTPLLAVVFLVACGGPPQKQVTRRRGSALVGTPDPTSNPAHPQVVALFKNGDHTCTGTFITPHLVLTAAHCFVATTNTASHEGYYCPSTSTAGPCAAHNSTFRQDGWLSKLPTGSTFTATDGAIAGDGTTYTLDYVWFAEWGIAVAHSSTPFTAAAPAKVMDKASAIGPAPPYPWPSEWAQADLLVVGTSSYGGVDARRRTGTVRFSTFPTANPLSFYYEAPIAGATDAGAPIFYPVQGTNGPVYQVMGIHFGTFPVDSPPRTVGNGLFVVHEFLDQLCPNATYDNCVWSKTSGQLDTDQDGVPDTTDNCRTVANRDQANCNERQEALTSIPHLGDACDPTPCTKLPTGMVGGALRQTDAVTANGPLPWLVSVTAGGGETSFRFNPHGFTPSLFELSKNVRPLYCACHTLQGKQVAEADCLQNYCTNDPGQPLGNIFDDTGYQTTLWTKAPTSPSGCSRTNTDLDGNNNDCISPLPGIAHKRLYLGQGTPFCTKRNEDGCRAGDSEAFWLRPTMAVSASWDWLAQDYPHADSPTSHYNPLKTSSAYVRLWVHSEEPSSNHRLAGTFSHPKKLAKDSRTFFVVRGPLYDKKVYRWWMETPFIPNGPANLLTPLNHDTQLPNDWQWLSDRDDAATSALAVTEMDDIASTSSTAPSVFVGDYDRALTTVGFGAARFDTATFAFGGQDYNGSLSSGLWMGIREGESFYWQPVAGANTKAMSLSPAPSKATGAALPLLSPSPRYPAWKKGAKASFAGPRPSLSSLAASSKKAFLAATAARKSVRKLHSQAKNAATSKLVVAFSAGTPLPQRYSATVINGEEFFLFAAFGEPQEHRKHGDPVPVALWDFDANEWIVGDVNWSCGPRYDVAYTATGVERSIILYGGRIDGEVVDGLYLKRLSHETLFDGSDVTRLDAIAAESGLPTPGPRADAVLTYDAANQTIFLFGGKSESGAVKRDLWSFSRKSGKWTQLDSGEGPTTPDTTLAAGLVFSRHDGGLLLIAALQTESGSAFWRWVNGSWRPVREPQ